MADNRIYMRCRICGKELFLGKRFGEKYYWENYGKRNNEISGIKQYDERPLEERLNEFYDKHAWCGWEKQVEDGNDQFEISYEDEPRWHIAEIKQQGDNEC